MRDGPAPLFLGAPLGSRPRPRRRLRAGTGGQLPLPPLSRPLPPLSFFTPDSRLPTSPVILLFSSLLLRPSPPLAPSFPQAPRSDLPSRSPRLFSPLLPTCLLVGPPPSAFPGPARAPHAKASRKSLGQAAHSPPRASWPGPSSSCLQRDLPHGSLSPCPLQEWRGPRGDKGQRPLLSLPFASSSNRTSRDAARRVTAWRGTAGRWHPEWGGPEGCSKGHQSESSAQRGAGSVPEGHILEGSSP